MSRYLALIVRVQHIPAVVARFAIDRPFRYRHRRVHLAGVTAHPTAAWVVEQARVRIGGEEWTARAYDETLVIPKGAIVDVMEIKGSTALVYPRE